MDNKLIAAIVFSSAFAPVGLGAVRSVPGTYPTIQAGIDAAADGDTVRVAAGTYAGPGNRDIDFRGKAIVVQGAGSSSTAVDAGGAGRVFIFHSGETAASVLEDFTICGGFQVDGGGGILCENASSPTIRDCLLEQNRSNFRGGAACCSDDSSPLFLRCAIRNNFGSNGGGVYGPAVLQSCAIEGNATDDMGGGGLYNPSRVRGCTIRDNGGEDDGGGILAEGDVTIEDCAIEGNRASGGIGGGICDLGGHAIIRRCRIVGNTAQRACGGIHGGRTIEKCLVLGNSCEQGSGGGIATWGAEVINCVVAGNSTADGDGGGIFAGAGTKVMQCTVTGNSASGGTGGGIACEGAPITLLDDIVWSNSPSNFSSCPACFQCVTAANPLFVDAAADDYHLRAGSPAVDIGAGSAADDLDGNPRPCGRSGDAGAYERCQARFIRGYCNADRRLDIADAVTLLSFLFLGGPDAPCLEACDVNDDGRNDVSDAVGSIQYLFLGGPSPRRPFPDCGVDPTPDALGCLAFACP